MFDDFSDTESDRDNLQVLAGGVAEDRDQRHAPTDRGQPQVISVGTVFHRRSKQMLVDVDMFADQPSSDGDVAVA